MNNSNYFITLLQYEEKDPSPPRIVILLLI